MLVVNVSNGHHNNEELKVCRLCCNVVSPMHCLALFSTESVKRKVPERLSKAIDLSVSSSDGLSPYHIDFLYPVGNHRNTS